MAKSKSVTTLIHEFDLHGNHRLVSIKDGVSQQGDWAGYQSIASFGKYHATTDYFAGVLPGGVFTTNNVAHTKLGD